MTSALARRADREVSAWLAAKRSAETRAAYAADLRAVGRFLAGNDVGDADAIVACLRADLRALVRWREAAAAAGEKPATIARRIAGLRTFYRYAQTRKLRADNPAAFLEAPRVNPEDQRRPFLERSDVRALIAGGRRGRRGYEEANGDRNEAAIRLAAGNGLRRVELARLTVADFDPQAASIRVHGKRDKVRILAVPPRVVELLAQLARERQPTDPLLRMSRAHIGRILRRAAARAGLDTADVTPHALRRTWVTLYNDQGGSRSELLRAGGWADGRTLDRYDRRKAAAAVVEY